MSTLPLPSKSSEGTFSYAAAASGKPSPKPTVQNTSQPTSQNSNSGTSTPNGISSENTKGQTTVTTIEARSAPKQMTSNSSLSAANCTVAVANGESSSNPSSHDQKPSNDEKTSSGERGSQPVGNKTDNNKQPASGEPARERLVPAPPPPVNIWNVRAEEFKAKAKQPVASPVAASKPASSKAAEKPTEAKQADRKRGSKQTDSGNCDTEKIRESGAHDRKDTLKDVRDRKKSTDAGRVNSYPPREDGNIRHGRSSRHITKSGAEKETVMAELPLSLDDATSWPTPETAQDEKKEKERLQAEKEKEKPTVARSSGPAKFVPAPFTPNIVHNSPLPTKGGRGGRGGRGGSAGRGGNLSPGATEGRQDRVDKSEKVAGTNPLTQSGEDRGRVGSRGTGVSSRGSYHGSSRGGGRRTGSLSSNSQGKLETPVNPSQEKRESQQSVANKVSSVASENTAGEASRTPSQQGEVRIGEQNLSQQPDDGAFIDQGVVPRQYSERTERVHSHSFATTNGQGYQKADGTNTPAEGFPPSRSERGSASSRGGYRGRGGQYNTPHPHASHSNSISGQAYHPHHNQGQYAPHTQSYRSYGRGSRGHSAAPRGYHQSYQPGVFPNQQYPPPYGGYYEYINLMNNPSLPTMSMNNSSTIPVPDDPLAHRDYPHGANAHVYYANVVENVSTQMNYYFSVDNLCRDIWLRKQMDSGGWVSLSVFAGFTMIRKHTHNMHLLRDACAKSGEIEVQLAADGYRVRKKHNFQLFVLSKEDRAPEVQQREDMETAAAKKEQDSESAQPSEYGRSQMSAAARPFQPTLHQKSSLGSLQSAAQSAPPVLNGAPAPASNNIEINGIQRRHSQLSADAAEFTMPNGFTLASPVPQVESQAADFPDEQIGHIIIVYKKSLLNNETSPGGSPAVNGEFSSICNSNDGTESCQCSPRSGRLSRHGVGWTLDQDPEDSNLHKHEHEEYTKIRTYSLKKRREGEPDAAKIIILCRFWSHFLLNQFNRKMYEDFKSFALDDALATGGLSLEILFGFYEAIHVTGSPRDEMTWDFVDLARKFAANGSNVGLSRLESTLNNPHLKPEVDNSLRGLTSTVV